MNTERHRVLKGVAVAVLVLAVLVALPMAIGGVRLRREMKALERGGRPMTIEQLIPTEVSDAHNGAPLVLAAHSLLAGELIGTNSATDVLYDVADRIREEPLSEAEQRLLAEFFRSRTAGRIWELLRDGIRRESCRFQLAWDQGLNMNLSHLTIIHGLSRDTSVKALVEVREGRGREAWETMEVGLQAADILRDEPLLISQLLRIAQLSVAMATIRAAVATAPPTAEQAQTLIGQLQAFDLVPRVARCLDGERLLAFDWMRQRPLGEVVGGCHTLSETDWKTYAKLRLAGLLWAPVRDLDLAAYLRIMRGYAEAPKRPPRAWLTAYDEDPSVPRYCVMTAQTVPSIGSVWHKVALVLADRAVTETGLLLLTHKGRHGAYPETLDELDADLKAAPPIDPLTGEPLAYHREGDGFVLYSVGKNLTDDGGSEELMKEYSATMDIVWRMSR